MNILKKRVLAFVIDVFVFASFFVICQMLIPQWLLRWENLVNLLLLISLFLKDLIFRNASIGKKIMGLAIYDDRWSQPKPMVLIKRAVFMQTVGYAILWKAKFVDGDLIFLFDWERDKLHTRVVDKKTMNRFREIAKSKNGDYAANMTSLYNEYLRTYYN